MVRPLLAFVNFFKEARGKRTALVKDVVEFASNPPKHHSDFVKDKIYLVKWPHLPTEGSFSEEGNYEAKILCLGVTMEDLDHEVKALGARIPSADFTTFKDVGVPPSKDKKSSSGKKQTECSARASTKRPKEKEIPSLAPPSHQSRKRKNRSIEEVVKKKRTDNVLAFAGSTTLPFPPEVQDSIKSVCEEKSIKEEKQTKDCSNEVNETTFEEEKQDVDSQSTNSGTPGIIETTEGGMVFKASETSVSAVICGEKVRKLPSRKAKKKPGTDVWESESSSDAASYASSTTQEKTVMDMYVQKIRRLEIDLKCVKSDNRTLQSNMENLESEAALLKAENGRLSSLNSKLTEQLLDNQNCFKQFLSYKSCSAEELKAPVTPVSEGSKNFPSPLGSKVSKSLPKPNYQGSKEKCVSKSDKATANQESMSSPISSKDPDNLSSSSDNEESKPKSVSKALFSTPAPDPDGSSARGSKGSPKKKKKMREASSEGNISSSAELSDMILRAIKDNVPLSSDGNGKVHIGNNVYISESAFKNKIALSKVSPPIALRDAAGALYSVQDLAVRSLEGGTPVKDKASEKKMKLTPAKRESLLGIYRAETALASGCSGANFLNLKVSTQGRSILREKLKESAKKMKKAAELKGKEDD